MGDPHAYDLTRGAVAGYRSQDREPIPDWYPGERILVGTGGYAFGDWVGNFYPEHFPFRDMLSFYSQRFPVVEVHSTYQRIPTPQTFAQMVSRTPPGFRFIVKLNRVLTHEGRIAPESISAFRACLEPLQAAGKLAGLLAQFPWTFKNDSWRRRYLAAVRRALPDAPMFAEFRHASWAETDTWSFLREHQIGFCGVDVPNLHGLMPPILEQTVPWGYVRFHGRNANGWWGQRGGDARHNYAYSTEELTEWVSRIHRLAETAEKVYVFFNNCHAGQAAHNARLMQRLLERT